MSKPSLNSVTLARKGHAAPAHAEEATVLEPMNQGRKRPWDGINDPIKANFEVSAGLLAKIAWLKSHGYIRTQKEFVQESLDAAADRLIAKAEKDGF